MKKSEYELRKNGVTDITELLIGYDGLSIAVSRKNTAPTGPDRGADLPGARRRGSEVDGKKLVANPYKTWNEIDPSLPTREDHRVRPAADLRHPRRLRRTRHARRLRGLPGDQGARRSDRKAWNDRLQRMRQDGPFIEAGENDNLIVQRLQADPNALGIFGYSFLYENQDTLKAVKVNGVEPTFDTIADGSYKIARPIFFYVKNAHRGVIPGLNEFVAEYVSDARSRQGGYLSERGLTPLRTPARKVQAARRAASWTRRSLRRSDTSPRGHGTAAAPFLFRLWRRLVFGYGCAPLILVMSLVAFCRPPRGAPLRRRRPAEMHSLPVYHGAFVAIWVGIPAFILVLLWVALQDAGHRPPAADRQPAAEMTRRVAGQISPLSLRNQERRRRAALFGEPSPAIRAAAADATSAGRDRALGDGGRRRRDHAARSVRARRARAALPRPQQFRARDDRADDLLLGRRDPDHARHRRSLLFEAWRFFRWCRSPSSCSAALGAADPIREDQVAGLGAFGAVPVFTGTLLIATIAMLVATPIGCSPRSISSNTPTTASARVVKPMLEILAGIPTVVYGFFAVLTVAPAIRSSAADRHRRLAQQRARRRRVMGIMIIPFISSLSDDALNAVPRAMRDGSLAMGATPGETMTQGAAAGGAARHHGRHPARAQPRHRRDHDRGDGRRPDRDADAQSARRRHHRDRADRDAADRRHRVRQPKTLAAFALGLVLFVVTLGLNVRRSDRAKYREKYD
jgi:phosphate transport system substrate-binding protein